MRGSSWYVAQTLGGMEGTAERHLIREGFTKEEVFVTKRADGRRVFPNYVFVRVLEARGFSVINRTRGVVKMLPRHVETPLPLPVGFVEDLRFRLAEGDLSEAAETAFLHRWIAGEWVTAVDGTFRDQRGRFLRYTKDCAVLLGCLLGKGFEYKVPLAQLRAAAA